MAEGKRVIVGDRMVKITCDVNQGKGDNKQTLIEGLSQMLDFSKCSADEILDLAAGAIVVKLQNGVWRNMTSAALADEVGKTVDVHEFINRPIVRGAIDPEAALLRKADKGEVDLADVIAKLQAKLAEQQSK